jgi:hypothetical protein
VGHGGLSRAASVHGFTSAFTVAVGIFAVAAIVVVTLIRPHKQRDADSGDVVYGDDRPAAGVPVAA